MTTRERAFELLNAGKWADASNLLRKLIDANPFDAALRYNLAYALQEAGNKPEAVTHYLATIALDANNASALNNFGNLLVSMGRRADAMKAFRRALDIDPDHVNANKMLGLILSEGGAPPDAVTHLRRAVALAPKDLEALLFLAQAVSKQNEFAEAMRLYEEILALEPGHWVAHNNLAGALKKQGRLDEALVHWHRARESRPDEHILLSNIILASHYTPHVDPETRIALARSWGQTFGAPLLDDRAAHDIDTDPNRPIRIGYLSSDFRGHPIGHFMIGVFQNHDPDNVQVHAYSATTKEDALTEAFRACDCVWRDIAAMDDAAVAEQIGEDGIDILVDLAGHTEGNRLLVLARRPAPIQGVAGGYMCTTGLDAVDFAIADAVHAPPGCEEEFTESLFRMPDGYVCYTPPTGAPDVRPLPALSHEQVTLGCLNNPAKLGPEVIALWAQVLRRLPGARLLLAAKSFEAQETRGLFQTAFGDHDIDPARIIFEGGAPHDVFLDFYNRIDVALDPFPYSGGLTTCEALWMGVPVVTLGGGNSFASRHAAGHLGRVGLGDLVATSPADYIAQVENLTHDLERLGDMRLGLRDRMASSPLCDCAGHTRALETAYRDAWRDWCQSQMQA